MNPTALEVLKARAKMRSSKTDQVFYSGNEDPINAGNLLRCFYSSVKKVGLKALRFHDLRHIFATRLVQAGVDLYMVQRLGR